MYPAFIPWSPSGITVYTRTTSGIPVYTGATSIYWLRVRVYDTKHLNPDFKSVFCFDSILLMTRASTEYGLYCSVYTPNHITFAMNYYIFTHILASLHAARLQPMAENLTYVTYSLLGYDLVKPKVDFAARSRYLRQWWVITPHSKLRDVITYPCLRYLLLATSPHI